MKITATFQLVAQCLNRLHHRVPTKNLLPLPGFETRPIQPVALPRYRLRYLVSCNRYPYSNLQYILQLTRL